MILQDHPGLFRVKASDIPKGYHFVITRPNGSVIARVCDFKDTRSTKHYYKRALNNRLAK